MKNRKEVLPEDTWNLTSLYPSIAAWEAEFASVDLSKIDPFKGKLHEQLSAALDTYFTIIQQLEKLYTYAHLKHDEEITDPIHKSMQERAQILLQHFAEKSSWLEPEIFTIKNLVLPEKYRFHLEKLLRLKEHILSAREEELLAAASRALQSSYKTFSSINNADFKFPQISDSHGKLFDLTHGSYSLHLQSRDRTLRENTFKTLHGKYLSYENTLCEVLQGQILSHQFEAKARHYNSCLTAALKPKNIDLSVYHTLIAAVRENIDALHGYFDLRKKKLNLPKLHLYDMSVPLTTALDINIPYPKARQLVIDSVAPLGAEYQNILQDGLNQARWVDRYENRNKRSGGYSSGCFESQPYILMNYKGTMRDLFTLAHEAGHSMHSYYSHKSQPFHYSSYPIFVAEVASTFNEGLLFHLLMQGDLSQEEKTFYLTSRIDDIRATLFRQTLFAEFELLIHSLVEQNIPLTPQLLKAEYRKLNEFYFGKDVVIDDIVDIEWARIPHFYYNYYVYQYATGISAAIALVEKVLKEGKPATEAYLSFLKGGCSKDPIDLLELAGVNMREKAPIVAAIDHFRSLVLALNT